MAEYIFLSGKAKWFKPHQPNKFGAWSHDIYLDDVSLTKVKELMKGSDTVEGIKNKLSMDEDGQRITVKRDTSKTMRGKVVGFAPPTVLGPDSLPLVDQMVGNGSDITTKIEYYTYNKPGIQGGKKGAAIRWLSTRVDNLVPFKLNRDFDEDGEKQVRGLAEQPAQPLF